jgi:hypothetical protein
LWSKAPTRHGHKETPLGLALPLLALLLVVLGCQGSRGPEGLPGPNGPDGGSGPSGSTPSSPCVATPEGTPGVNVDLSLSTPSNGQFFVVGEHAVVRVKLSDSCGGLLKPSDLGLVQLYVAGPRQTLAAQTALKLLNAVSDRNAADNQHHFVSLIAPSFADPTQNNLTVANDGTVTYQLAPVSTEAAGTYTVGLWAKSNDNIDQIFALKDLQIGTDSAEQFASGPADSSSCLTCHLGPVNNKVYMAHIQPGMTSFGSTHQNTVSVLGEYALDSAPVGTCTLCHNNDGFSPNTDVRKVHGVHRGEHQQAAGIAHPEYGVLADASLADYTNVGFPAMPTDDPPTATTAMEKDCGSCHTDNRWQTSPSRLACGTCHDNVFFDTGVINPPRVFGQPSGVACTSSAQCSTFGSGAVCNTATGDCERIAHAAQPDDAQCATCHGPTTGVAPVVEVHSIPLRTAARGIQVTVTSASGGSEPGGVFKPGDTPVVTFKLTDRSGNNIEDLLTNANLAGSAVAAGPNGDPRRVYGTATGALSMAKGTLLTYDPAGQVYTFTFPTGWPTSNITPVNNLDLSLIRPNPAGAYTLYIYVAETLQPSGARDASGAVTSVKFVPTAGAPATFSASPRDVITQGACDSCHVKTQAHGGGRADPQGCFTCHNPGGMDRTVGAQGINCTLSTDCPGFNAGNPGLSWETCTAGKCTITKDPTPNQTVEFGPLMHMLHFARLLDGYAERANLVTPGLQVVGFNNTVNNFSQVLFPQDVRNCTKCHGDTKNSCSDNTSCGFGQTCSGSKCVNNAWQTTGSKVCLSCHDSAADYTHAQANTGTVSGITVETCDICHGATGEFSVAKVHNIRSPYVPPYLRQKE